MPKRVLHIDPDRSVTAEIQIYLRDAGFESEILHDCSQAIDKIKTDKPDLVILELKMPLSGFEIMQAMKRDQETTHIPIIALTIDESDSTVFAAWSYVTHILHKPEVPSRVIAFAKKAVKMKLTPEEERITGW